MQTKLEFTAPGGDRLDVFLAQQVALSRAQLQKLILKGDVLVDNQPAKPRQILKGGEQIHVTLPDPERTLEAEAVPLEIVYQDDDLLVINKPAGIVVHPQLVEEQGTVVHALLHHYPAMREVVYDPENPISQLRPGIVHRLDKDTSGLLVVAKTSQALYALAEQFRSHAVQKSYLALVHGQVKEPKTLHTWLERKAARENMMKVSRQNGIGREAITHLTPKELLAEATLLEVRIETGRTHQIRVHCKYLGHPVLGDTLYTNKAATNLSEKLHLERQMLHAYQLDFTHPVNHTPLHFEARLPEDFAAALTQLR